MKNIYKIIYSLQSAGNNVKIIDCFTFYNEFDMLSFRLEELNDYVDYFILVEANKTFAGNDKEFYFETNKNKYTKFLDKIIHIKINDMPTDIDAWGRESFQRNCINRGIEKLNLDNDDVIIISDLDEIPNRLILKDIKQSILIINKIYKLSLMDLYYYNLTCKTDNKSSTSTLLTYKKFKENNCSAQNISRKYDEEKLQNYHHGWHFSYFFDSSKIINKIQNFAHQEYNNSLYTDKDIITDKISKCKDLFGRDNIKWKYVSINENKNLPKNYKLLLGGNNKLNVE